MVMQRIFKYFLPTHIEHDDIEISYAKNLIGAVVTSFFACPCYALIYYFLGYPAAAIYIFIADFFMISSLFILKFTRSIMLASNIFVVAFVVLITYLTYQLGGIFSATAYWLAITPLVASFIAGIRAGYFWCLASILLLTIVYGFNYVGFKVPHVTISDPLLLQYTAILGLTLVVIALVYFYDLSKKAGYDALKQIAYLDPLTRIANRTSYDELLEKAIKKMQKSNLALSLLYLDIDNFNKVNNSFGNLLADSLLKEVAYRIKRYIRHTDSIARVGGDQFKIIIENIQTKEELAEIANILLKSFEVPFNIKKHEINITISIGVVSSLEANNFNPKYIDQYAEIALSKAKNLGGNTLQFYDNELAKENSLQIEIERLLPDAIKNNEFHLCYQFQFDTKNPDEITGLEVLLRWNNKKHGEIPSSLFIPIAEKAGSIAQIGEWVLKEACEQFMVWYREGLVNDLIIAVNTSMYQLYNESLFKYLKIILKDTQIPVSQLELEITETVIALDPNNTMRVLKKISALGVKTVIDDFGAGYTSLSYLTLFPISRLKIDKLFLENMLSQEATAIVIESIIDLAHKINLKVVVEGIENIEQLTYLQKVNCDYVQGFYLSKPLNAEDTQKHLVLYGKKKSKNK